MTTARGLLARYLAQRIELGERDLALETLTTSELFALLSGAARQRARAATAGVQATGGAGVETLSPAAEAGARPGVRPERGVGGPEGGAPPHGPSAEKGRAWWALPVFEPDPATLSSLSALSAEAAGCTRCRLHAGRRTVVFARGTPAARVVVVGEAPGQEEDRTGLPFVGPAGRLLDRLLLAAGFPRDQVYICNVLKCRPPNNRNPQEDEIEACSGYLRQQIELIGPAVLVAVGKFAARTLLETETSISRLRGQLHRYRGVPVVATYHPAFLLRSPQWMRAAWRDFQLVRKVLDEA